MPIRGTEQRERESERERKRVTGQAQDEATNVGVPWSRLPHFTISQPEFTDHSTFLCTYI